MAVERLLGRLPAWRWWWMAVGGEGVESVMVRVVSTGSGGGWPFRQHQLRGSEGRDLDPWREWEWMEVAVYD